MKGYLNKPEATAEPSPRRLLRTGDIGRVDADGYVRRRSARDMIISGGENIYSIEVERVLAEHLPRWLRSRCSRPDEKWGEAVKAVVALDKEASSGRRAGEVSADDLITRAGTPGRLQVPEDGGLPSRCCRATRLARS